jgi:hypothetical protein
MAPAAAFADTIDVVGYLDPNASDPSLPAFAQRVGFDMGAPQAFPSEHTNVVLANFTLAISGSFTIESRGYGITGLGIDPYITLFSGSTAAPGSATFVLEHSPGGDFTFNTPVLTSGNYVLAIGAWSNYGCPFGFGGCSLADGFSGLANLEAGHDTFFDFRITGDVRTGPSTQPVPEPAMILPITALAAGLLGFARARQRIE